MDLLKLIIYQHLDNLFEFKSPLSDSSNVNQWILTYKDNFEWMFNMFDTDKIPIDFSKHNNNYLEIKKALNQSPVFIIMKLIHTLIKHGKFPLDDTNKNVIKEVFQSLKNKPNFYYNNLLMTISVDNDFDKGQVQKLQVKIFNEKDVASSINTMLNKFKISVENYSVPLDNDKSNNSLQWNNHNPNRTIKTEYIIKL